MKKLLYALNPTETGTWTEKYGKLGELVERFGAWPALAYVLYFLYTTATGGDVSYLSYGGLPEALGLLGTYYLARMGEE